MGEEVEEGLVRVGGGELLRKDVCWDFKKDGRTKAVVRVCEYKREKAAGADSLVRKRCVRSKYCFVDKMAFLSENLEKAGRVGRELNSSALGRPRAGSIE